jgi:hypothetical protein
MQSGADGSAAAADLRSLSFSCHLRCQKSGAMISELMRARCERFFPWLVSAALLLRVSAAAADPVTDATSRVTATLPAEASGVTSPPPPPENKLKLQVSFAGGVALSAAFIDWNRPTASLARDGDLRFSVLRIGARASYDAFKL